MDKLNSLPSNLNGFLNERSQKRRQKRSQEEAYRLKGIKGKALRDKQQKDKDKKILIEQEDDQQLEKLETKDKSLQDWRNFKRSLTLTSKKDFDGHSDFISLPAEQKLRWLSDCAHFAILARQAKLV